MASLSEREKVAHLLRRFGLGSSEAELDYYGRDGAQGALKLLLNYQETDEGFDLDVRELANANGRLNIRAAQSWWLLRLCVTKRPLQEKLTLFWHDHFATSAQKVDVPEAMVTQNEVLRAHAAGSFETLLLEASKDPAMLYWLDNQLNVAGKPNENFAREIMELFTLGIGHYSERDVQEAARAFTGWTYRAGPRARDVARPVPGSRFVFREDRHDDGEKTLLGQTGRLGGEDVVRTLAHHPETARTLATKLWEWFVYPAPEPALVERLASVFQKSDLSIRQLMRSIAESPEFYSDKAVRRIYKNPIDFCVATCRQLGIGRNVVAAIREAEANGRLRALGPIGAILQATKSMGMELFFPPDVAGWDGGSAWISSATMVERIKWADRLFGSSSARGSLSLRYPTRLLFPESAGPEEVVARLLSIFDAQLPPDKTKRLEEAARGADGSAARALAVCRLLFGSPEFQFC